MIKRKNSFLSFTILSSFMMMGFLFFPFFSVTAASPCPTTECKSPVDGMSVCQYADWCKSQPDSLWDGCKCKKLSTFSMDLNIPIPGLGTEAGAKTFSGGLPVYLAAAYQFFIAASVIVSLAMIIIGGFQWLSSGGRSDAISSAKERIKNASIGVILALFSYSILYFINPDLIKLSGAQPIIYPPLALGAYTSCNEYLKDPYYADAAGFNRVLKDCGENLTVKELNDANIKTKNGGPLVVLGGENEVACVSIRCSGNNTGSQCASDEEGKFSCVSLATMASRCNGVSTGFFTNVEKQQEQCSNFSFNNGVDEFTCALEIMAGGNECRIVTTLANKSTSEYINNLVYVRDTNLLKVTACSDINNSIAFYESANKKPVNYLKEIENIKEDDPYLYQAGTKLCTTNPGCEVVITGKNQFTCQDSGLAVSDWDKFQVCESANATEESCSSRSGNTFSCVFDEVGLNECAVLGVLKSNGSILNAGTVFYSPGEVSNLTCADIQNNLTYYLGTGSGGNLISSEANIKLLNPAIFSRASNICNSNSNCVAGEQVGADASIKYFRCNAK